MSLDFLVIGHITKDLTPQGYRLGGAATYAAVAAQRLGARPSILTRAAADVVADPTFQEMEVLRLPSEVTTTFDNVYRDGHRQQFIHATAGPIDAADVPSSWRRPSIVLLAPVAQEVEPKIVELFPASLVGVAPQGWFRRWDERGRVSPTPWLSADWLLPRVDVAILSESDVGQDLDLVEHYATLARFLLLTQGDRGCTLFVKGCPTQLPARETGEVDPTGAGDVFAAAFLLHLAATQDPVEAARFANAGASFSIEAPGIQAIPTHDDLGAWLRNHPDWARPSGRDGADGQGRKTRVYAFANQKGGVGKTTTAVNLGAYLAEAGFRVLLADIDPQANATSSLGVDKRSLETTIYDVIIGRRPLSEAIHLTSRVRLDLLPSSPDLAGLEVEITSVREREQLLRRALESAMGHYDYILIDTPPSLGLLTINGLVAADAGVFVPVQCEYLALEGLTQLMQTIQLVRQNLNPRLQVAGLILTMYDARTNLAQQVVEEVRSHFPRQAMKTVVPRNVRLGEAPSFGDPIISYAPSSAGARAYEALADELVARERAASLPATGRGRTA